MSPTPWSNANSSVRIPLWDSTEIASSSAATVAPAPHASAIHRSFPETDAWSPPANAAAAPATYRAKATRKPPRKVAHQICGTEVWLETVASWAKLGVSHFVLDFGYVFSTEPVLRLCQKSGQTIGSDVRTGAKDGPNPRGPFPLIPANGASILPLAGSDALEH